MIRVLSQGAVDLDGTLEVSDVNAAYYHGDPPPPQRADGRYVFARIPDKWADLGVEARKVRAGGEFL